jgi:hypothetical protein
MNILHVATTLAVRPAQLIERGLRAAPGDACSCFSARSKLPEDPARMTRTGYVHKAVARGVLARCPPEARTCTPFSATGLPVLSMPGRGRFTVVVLYSCLIRAKARFGWPMTTLTSSEGCSAQLRRATATSRARVSESAVATNVPSTSRATRPSVRIETFAGAVCTTAAERAKDFCREYTGAHAVKHLLDRGWSASSRYGRTIIRPTPAPTAGDSRGRGFRRLDKS